MEDLLLIWTGSGHQLHMVDHLLEPAVDVRDIQKTSYCSGLGCQKHMAYLMLRAFSQRQGSAEDLLLLRTGSRQQLHIADLPSHFFVHR